MMRSPAELTVRQAEAMPVRSYAKDNRVLAEKFSQWLGVQNYSAHTRKAYDNRFCSIITVKNRKIVHWRDYMDSLAVINAVKAAKHQAAECQGWRQWLRIRRVLALIIGGGGIEEVQRDRRDIGAGRWRVAMRALPSCSRNIPPCGRSCRTAAGSRRAGES